MNLKKLFIILNGLNILAILIVIFVIEKYQSAYNQMEQTYISKNRSFLLADELRQSSDDLTRLARTYVITVNPRFKEQYYEVLAIRNGKHPRPSNYNRIYWDFLAVDGIKPKSESNRPAVALHVLMKNAGFTQEELKLLSKSQEQSDTLVHLEEVAMHAVEGLFEDKSGNYTVKGEPNLQLAREIMHSDEYHKSKVKIMNPLNKFFQLFEERTNLVIKKSKVNLNNVESFLITTVIIFFLLMITSIGIMFKRILYPLISLKESMLGLANNNLKTLIPPLKYQDEVGEMIGAVNVFKENTHKLVASERRIKLLLDSIGEGVFGLDENGCFTFVNPAACEFLDYTSEAIIGKYLYEIIYDKELPSCMKKLLLSEEYKQTSGEIKLQHRNRTNFPAEYVSTPIINKYNSIEGSVVVFSDITERKKNEEIMRLAKNNAEAANRSKSLFLANMSHELRTPLNAILGFTSLLLKDTSLRTTQKENIEIIYNSGKHLLNIISEILEIAKLQAGKIEIVHGSFALHGFLENIVFIFSNRAQEKGLTFICDDLADLPKFIISDEQRLRQIFFNILSNAIKFTNSGSITLHIKFINNHLKFSIIDTGPGINDEDMKIIFKPFEQIKSTQENYKGTGLGLTITKELITLMGGQINVTSEVGKGTSFNFNLYAEEDDGHGVISNRLMHSHVLLDDSSDKLMVLIVDDTYENRSLLVQMVKYLGFNTCEAEDGFAALNKLKEHSPDIILMDIQMPMMNGFEAIDKIRGDTFKPDIPIVLISANVFEGEYEKAIQRGANAFIGKPIRESDIISAMEMLLHIKFMRKDTLSDSLSPLKPFESKISIEDINQLQRASKELDVNTINFILLSYEENNPNMIKYIRNFIHNYQFGELISFLDEIKTNMIKN